MKYITYYLRDKYILEKMYVGIGGHFVVNECNLTHTDGKQVWVSTAKELRIDIIHGRNASNIEKFIKTFIPPNNFVISMVDWDING